MAESSARAAREATPPDSSRVDRPSEERSEARKPTLVKPEAKPAQVLVDFYAAEFVS
jgi:hypothetical protein